MISFTILTSDPAALRTLLIANGILASDGKGSVTPKPGVEFVIVPNPIVVTPGTEDTPAVMDTRKVFLVKVAHEALNFETKDDAQYDQNGNLLSILYRTKLGKWAAVNSVSDKIEGFDAQKINEKHWLVLENDGRFGVWQ